MHASTPPRINPEQDINQDYNQEVQENPETEPIYAEIDKKEESIPESSSSADIKHKSSSNSTNNDEKKRRKRSRKKAQSESVGEYKTGNDEDEVFSSSSYSESESCEKTEQNNSELRHRRTPQAPPQKPPRNSLHTQSSGGTSTPSSSPPSYRSNSRDINTSENGGSGQEDAIAKILKLHTQTPNEISISGDKNSSLPSYRSNSKAPSEFMIKLKYALRQKAFIVPITISITFATVYTALLYLKNQGNFLSKITNISNSEIYVPIIIASSFAILSAFALVYKYNKVNVKIPPVTAGDDGVFESMKNLDDDKCIRSIKLKYSNNTNVTYLDEEKYKFLGLKNKRLKLIIGNPLISFFGFVSLTTMITYLSTKCLEIGYEGLANSLESFSPTNTELMVVIIAVAVTTALFAYSIYHSYKKTHVQGIKGLEEINEFSSNKYEIIKYNKQYIDEVESSNADRGILKTQCSQGKVASLTIKQAIVEFYNSHDKVTIIPALAG